MVKMYGRKAAAGHVEIIISFLIFITFVVFLLVFVNPIEKTKDTQHYLDMTEKSVMGYLEANLTIFSISFDQAVVVLGGCYCVDYDYPSKVIGKDDSDNRVPAITNGDDVCVDTVAGKTFYRLYFSEEFVEDSGSCAVSSVPLSKSDYTLGVINKYKKVSNQSLYNLNQAYDTGYETLRIDTLKLNNHFNIEVKTTSGEVLASGIISEPKETEIVAKDIPIEVINKDGEIIPAIMNIQVWD